MIRMYWVISAVVTLFGCVANDESSAQLGSWSANAIADCDPDLPLCECTLKNSPVCADPDNDGVPNMNDNCPNTPNPGQENCDGDANGDACDSDNAILFDSPRYIEHEHFVSAAQSCLTTQPPGPFQLGFIYNFQDWTITWRTDHWATLCGPSGSGTVSRGFTESPQGLTCVDGTNTLCPGPGHIFPGQLNGLVSCDALREL